MVAIAVLAWMPILVCAPASAQVLSSSSDGLPGAIIRCLSQSSLGRISLPVFPAILDYADPGDTVRSGALPSTGPPLPRTAPRLAGAMPRLPASLRTGTSLYMLYSAYLL